MTKKEKLLFILLTGSIAVGGAFMGFLFGLAIFNQYFDLSISGFEPALQGEIIILIRTIFVFAVLFLAISKFIAYKYYADQENIYIFLLNSLVPLFVLYDVLFAFLNIVLDVQVMPTFLFGHIF